MQLSQSRLNEERRLLARVAYLYYSQRQTQTAIAQQLDLSQATVSRMLKRAEEEGIVRISVNMPTGVYTDLEDALCDHYGLKQAIVVHCDDENEDSIYHHIGSAAAYYVETTIGKQEIIGLSSWSATLLAMVDTLHPLAKSSGAKVVQILGGVGNPSAEIYATRITERFTRLLHGEAVYLPAPGVVTSAQLRDELMNNTFVRQAVALFDQITLALVGIGSIEPSKLLAQSGNIFSEDELNLLRENGAIGDICLRFFNADGQPVITPLDERVISMNLHQLKQVRRTVGIAGGKRKVDAIRGALVGGYINVLITDHHTAGQLLDQKNA